MENTSTEKKQGGLKEIVRFTITAVIIIFIVRIYIAQPFVVNGASMDPTFASNDYLIVDELSYRFEEPKREDVIIFRYPRNTSTFFIKRIIGLPGETVIMQNGDIIIKNKDNIQGMKIEDNHVENSRRTNDTFSISLGPTEYFVMGDNRAQSSDSRSWGPLERKYIIGRPITRLLPFSKIALFPGK